MPSPRSQSVPHTPLLFFNQLWHSCSCKINQLNPLKHLSHELKVSCETLQLKAQLCIKLHLGRVCTIMRSTQPFILSNWNYRFWRVWKNTSAVNLKLPALEQVLDSVISKNQLLCHFSVLHFRAQAWTATPKRPAPCPQTTSPTGLSCTFS